MNSDPFLQKYQNIKNGFKKKGIKSNVYNKHIIHCQICDKNVQITGAKLHIFKSHEHDYLLDKFHNPEDYKNTDGVENFFIERDKAPGYMFIHIPNYQERMREYLQNIKGHVIAQIRKDILRRKYTISQILNTDKLNTHGRLSANYMEIIRQRYLNTL